MKSPTIEIIEYKKKYYVLFGINEKIEFPNKTLAKLYTYDLKKLIRDVLYLVSNIQNQLYSSYSSNYFHLDETLNKKLRKEFENFENQRDLIFSSFSKGNGSFLFKSIENCFYCLDTSILLLKEYSQVNKQFALKNEMYALIRHLDVIKNTFETDKKNISIDFKIRNKEIKVIQLIKNRDAI